MKVVIIKGEHFNEKNICTKRPARGIPAFMWHDIIGKKAKQKFKINEKIET